MKSVLLVLLGVASGAALGQINQGIPEGSFGGATIESFSDPFDGPYTSYTWAGSGLVHNNLNGQADYANYTGSFGMGDAPFVDGGKDGPGTGYFGSGETPTTFEFILPDPSYLFGFYGAEAFVSDFSFGRNGELSLEFYDTSDVLIGALVLEATPIDVHAWNQFHGFSSDTAIGRVVFVDVGHMVVDDVRWLVPAPSAAGLLALAGLAATRRRR